MIETVQKINLERIGPVQVRRVGFDSLTVIADMNRKLFDEERIINRFDRRDLLMLMAFAGEQPAGFKIGYGFANGDYYSAKGGVMPRFRRMGIARALLLDMMERARGLEYHRFAFDTFPNIHIGMTRLAIDQGFVLSEAQFSDGFDDYRLRFVKKL